jgi:hypothetical protein
MLVRMYQEDRKVMRHLKNALKSGNLVKAGDIYHQMDTCLREKVPVSVLKLLEFVDDN